eukprot:4613609-Lingulodinium_polyedra.AAC.1
MSSFFGPQETDAITDAKPGLTLRQRFHRDVEASVKGGGDVRYGGTYYDSFFLRVLYCKQDSCYALLAP